MKNIVNSVNNFLEAASNDERLSMTHFCTYVALLQCWIKNGFQNPVRIRRCQIMRLAKINAKTTYHKCVKELQLTGYIKYEPSFEPQGSKVHILDIYTSAMI